jgi:hypothetical protein
MPRFYFNLVRGSEVVPDLEGAEASDLGEARREALAVILEARWACEPDDWLGWSLEIADTRGRVLATYSLAEEERIPTKRYAS